MRPAAFVLLCCALACEEPNAKIDQVTVEWMDWPAEVNADQPFRTRLIVSGVCATNPRFHAGGSADQSAVTFAPYFQVDNDHILCLEAVSTLLTSFGVDTAGTAPGLPATSPRSYEMRGVAWPAVPSAAAPQALPIRTFGEVTVRPTGADPSHRNAAGRVLFEKDSLGCARVWPIGASGAHAWLVLEDQADTVGLSAAFVSGYVYEPAAPVCGETKVFHLVARQ